MRYFDGSFTTNFITTIGIDFKIKQVTVTNEKGQRRVLKLQIWDTAGQERFKTICTAYYRGAHGIFLVYGVDKKESFENVSSWLKQISKNASEDCMRVLLANKCDLPPEDWAVSREKGHEEAKKHSLPFFETSAKTGVNVDAAFAKMTEMVVQVLDRKADAKGSPRRRGEKKKALPDKAPSSGCGCA
eukprot:g719.t1